VVARQEAPSAADPDLRRTARVSGSFFHRIYRHEAALSRVVRRRRTAKLAGANGISFIPVALRVAGKTGSPTTAFVAGGEQRQATVGSNAAFVVFIHDSV